METNYSIINTNYFDLPLIYRFFEAAIVYQKTKNYPVWKGYDKDTLKKDIEENRQFKIVIDEIIACVFSICYTDSHVWTHREKGDALYLHRIVVNPVAKGQQHMAKIVKWSSAFALENKLTYLRMDTWGDNPNILAYYQTFGFYVVDYFNTPDTTDVPIQQRNNYVVLLEKTL